MVIGAVVFLWLGVVITRSALSQMAGNRIGLTGGQIVDKSPAIP